MTQYRLQTYQWLGEVHEDGSYQRGGEGVGASHPAKNQFGQ